MFVYGFSRSFNESSGLGRMYLAQIGSDAERGGKQRRPKTRLLLKEEVVGRHDTRGSKPVYKVEKGSSEEVTP